MATNEVYQLSVKGTVTGQTHVHTLHFLGSATGGEADALAASWVSTSMTLYRALFNGPDTPVQTVTAQKVCGSVPLPSAEVVVPSGGTLGGSRTVTGLALPSYVAALVTERGTIAGRRYSGRFFIGGLYAGDVTGNVVNPSYITTLTAYCTQLMTSYVTPGSPVFRLFCFSNLLADGDPNHTNRNPVPGGARISTPVTAVPCQQAGSPVASLVVSNRPTTMRSRKLGHGT